MSLIQAAWARSAFRKNGPLASTLSIFGKDFDELGLAQAFSPPEALFLASLEADERSATFYRIWTCKEAILKAYGFGIGEYLRDFTVIPSRENLQIEGSSNCPLASLSSVQVEALSVPPGFTATTALI